MAIDLNNQTVMIYNNVYLGSFISASAESEPVYSTEGAFQYSKTEFTIETIIPGGLYKSNYLVDSGSGDLSGYQITPDYEAGIRTDDVLNMMRNKLSERRKALYILNSGMGSYIINGQPSQAVLTASDIHSFLGRELDTTPEFEDIVESVASIQNRQDLMMGPIPKVLQWEPIGGRGSCRVVFKIEFHTKECFLWNTSSTGASNPIGKLSSFKYKTSYKIDDIYKTHRKIEGTAKIHQNVAVDLATGAASGLEVYAGNADLIRDSLLFTFLVPNNFRRVEKSFTLSEDKSTLNFSISDQEVDSSEPYPENVLNISMDHALDGLGPALVKWKSTISGSITLAPGIKYWRAWYIFSLIVINRLARGSRYPKQRTKSNQDGKEPTIYWQSANPIIKRLSIREKMYSNKSRFTFTLEYVLTANKPEDIFLATGVFTSISGDTGDTWSKWKSSITDVDRNTRGASKLIDSPYSVIVNSCLSYAPNNYGDQIINNSDSDAGGVNDQSDEQPQDFDSSLFSQNAAQINEQTSLVDYINKITLSTYSNSFEYQCAIPNIDGGDGQESGGQEDDYYNGKGSEKLPKLIGGVGAEMKKRGAGLTTKVIEVASPAVYLTIEGGSERMLGPTPSPEVLKVGGAEVQCIEDIYESEKLDDSTTLPVYRSMWTKTYRVLGTPKNYVLESNGEIIPS